MFMIRCTSVTPGLRSDERTVTIMDAQGRRDFIRLESDYLVDQSGTNYLPVVCLEEDKEKGVILIELPHESEGGNNRLWFKKSDTRLWYVTDIPGD
jgi:hypothetical protein